MLESNYKTFKSLQQQGTAQSSSSSSSSIVSSDQADKNPFATDCLDSFGMGEDMGDDAQDDPWERNNISVPSSEDLQMVKGIIEDICRYTFTTYA